MAAPVYSGDEVLGLLVAGVGALVSWGRWYWTTVAVARFPRPGPGRRLLQYAPLVCAAVLLAVLRLFASSDVRDSGPYLLFYTVLGAGWVGVAASLLGWFGLSLRDDAVERGNRAAAVALAGALLGLTLGFAGGNIGDGPGWWVVVFSAGLATAGLLLVMWAVQRVAGVVEAVTVGRDPASGWRLAGYLVAAGLILGRAVAGDWVSAAATLADFARVGWPALLLVPVAAVCEFVLRPDAHEPEKPVFTHGFVPGCCCVALAAAAVLLQGRWA